MHYMDTAVHSMILKSMFPLVFRLLQRIPSKGLQMFLDSGDGIFEVLLSSNAFPLGLASLPRVGVTSHPKKHFLSPSRAEGLLTAAAVPSAASHPRAFLAQHQRNLTLRRTRIVV
jgi:hypothetical protein